MTEQAITVSRSIPASSSEIFNLLSNPDRHTEFPGQGQEAVPDGLRQRHADGAPLPAAGQLRIARQEDGLEVAEHRRERLGLVRC